MTCPWPVDPGCLGDEWDNYDPAVQDRAVMLASATLHRLTGYRVGGCPVKVRPCKRSCGAAYAMPAYWDMAALYGTTPYPQIVGGVWINSCGCSTDCSCQALCEIALPPPVGEVQEVMLDGEVTDPADYRVDGNRLVWVGADECPAAGRGGDRRVILAPVRAEYRSEAACTSANCSGVKREGMSRR